MSRSSGEGLPVIRKEAYGFKDRGEDAGSAAIPKSVHAMHKYWLSRDPEHLLISGQAWLTSQKDMIIQQS